MDVAAHACALLLFLLFFSYTFSYFFLFFSYFIPIVFCHSNFFLYPGFLFFSYFNYFLLFSWLADDSVYYYKDPKSLKVGDWRTKLQKMLYKTGIPHFCKLPHTEMSPKP